MERVRAQVAERPRALVLTAAFAAIVGALSFAFNVGPALSGEVPAIGRAVLGLVGVAAGWLLWSRHPFGWLVGMAWAVIQIPVIAWNVDGSPTTQVLNFPLSASSQTTVNGEIATASEFGINLVGVALVIWLLRRRAAFSYQSPVASRQ